MEAYHYRRNTRFGRLDDTRTVGILRQDVQDGCRDPDELESNQESSQESSQMPARTEFRRPSITSSRDSSSIITVTVTSQSSQANLLGGLTGRHHLYSHSYINMTLNQVVYK